MGMVFSFIPQEKEQENLAVSDVKSGNTEHSCHEKMDRADNNASLKNIDTDKGKSNSNKGNCCSDKVKTFQQVDKLLNEVDGSLQEHFYKHFSSYPYTINLLLLTGISRNCKQFDRSHHPPIPDIRIAIQSFQI